MRLTNGEETLVRQVQCASGYLSHSSKTLHFGLGDMTVIEKAEIRWPSGTVQDLGALGINQLYEITEPAADKDLQSEAP
ncbi:MAG: ASPIC/UnbV domain-containing protein [Planctomycetota bacterium]|nr:ASPIC/UnbV domain-containing protein [Planctomycetota bacterium]